MFPAVKEVPVVFLVVESSPSVREALCYALLSFGIQGVPAASRKAAWEALDADGKIEGAIVDIDNADVEGARLVREIKENPRTRGLAVIVHTIESGRDAVMKMIEIGVAGYLLKPFSQETAHDKLSAILTKLSTHNSQRRHIRVKPDPDELSRVHFRLGRSPQLVSGRIIDISLGGMAVELFNPPSPEVLAPGVHVDKLQFVLAGRELSPAGVVILLKARVLALRFESLGRADTLSLERYVFKRISS